MTPEESVALVMRAKAGDSEAWTALCEKYYPRWIQSMHGRLWGRLRELLDTPDLVQSAIADALRDIRDLRCEAAFYSWVSAIMRRKIAEKYREERIPVVPIDVVGHPEAMPAVERDADPAEERYARLLDVIIDFFRTYPEAMAAIYLRYFEGLEIGDLMEVFRKSERSVYRLIGTGAALLKSKLRMP